MNVQQIDLVGRQIHFEAPQFVREAIGSIGRTEDVRFSPSNRRLAIADHFGNTIYVFEVSIEPAPNFRSIAVTSVTKISSAHLKRPHGLDFIDDEKIVVANRDGQACIFELPSDTRDDHYLEPLAVFTTPEISSPGSVAVTKTEQGLYEALICNNYANKITRHLFDFGVDCSFKEDTVLLRKWIRHPDGICVSKLRGWIAVSNHPTHAIFLYKNDSSLNVSSTPIGILHHYYPHGLRFAAADRLLVASSAGSPYLNIYQASDFDWRGVRGPTLSIKVLSDEDYLRLRDSRTEGGPKGVDINSAMNVLVMTCEQQPLAFFDLESLLKNICLESRFGSWESKKKSVFVSNSFLTENWRSLRRALGVRCQLYLGQIKAALTSIIRWVLTKIPTLSWILKKGRKLWNPQFLPKPF